MRFNKFDQNLCDESTCKSEMSAFNFRYFHAAFTNHETIMLFSSCAVTEKLYRFVKTINTHLKYAYKNKKQLGE